MSRVCVGDPDTGLPPRDKFRISVKSFDLKLLLCSKPIFESMKEFDSSLDIIEHSVSCVIVFRSFLVTEQAAEVQVFTKRACPYSFSHSCRSIKYQAPRPILRRVSVHTPNMYEAWEVAVGRRGFSPERSPPPPAGTAYRSNAQSSHRYVSNHSVSSRLPATLKVQSIG